MELSGNLWERVVTLGNATGRAFSGANGNGTLTSGGASDVAGWPAAAGTGWKGGSWLNTTTNSATTSDRAQAANADNTRAADAGGRGVRTISSGIVTDGLVLWLDAGITPSYPGSGTTWSDISGNRNNGTLTNGPTYSNSNGGSIGFDGVDDYVSLGNPTSLASLFGSSAVSINFWLKRSANITTQKIIFDSGTNEHIQLDIISNQLSFNLTTGTGITKSGASNTLDLNVWYNYVGVYDGSNITTYLNSIQITQIAKTGNILTDSGSFQISGWPAGGYVFTGGISSVKIYNKALSATEVLQNFNAQKALFGL
jgi:hypothetical protein